MSEKPSVTGIDYFTIVETSDGLTLQDYFGGPECVLIEEGDLGKLLAGDALKYILEKYGPSIGIIRHNMPPKTPLPTELRAEYTI